MRRSFSTGLALILSIAVVVAGVDAPHLEGSTKFAVIGDSGSGARVQYEVAKQLIDSRQLFPYTFIIMMGDNIYGDDSSKGYAQKFETPYKPLLDAGVPFYATLGNHDDPNQRNYKWFNMDGKRYYTFTKGPIEFFVIDSTYMDRAQLDWLDRVLSGSHARWKVAYGHHPMYSSGGRHGSEVDLRALVEPLFVKYGVDIVFAGHEHFYERIRPQRNIYYFTSGAAGKLRKGNINRGSLTAAGFDQDLSFMLVEIDDNTCAFQVISRTGETVDRGSFERPADPPPPTASNQ
jgi:predicted phosphodiesterase